MRERQRESERERERVREREREKDPWGGCDTPGGGIRVGFLLSLPPGTQLHKHRSCFGVAKINSSVNLKRQFLSFLMAARKVDVGLHGKGSSKLPWSKAGQSSHLVDVVDSDQ